MDKQWDKSDLISYLYGEIDQQKKSELEKALVEDPDLRHEMDELQETREIVSKLGDKEVIEPETHQGQDLL